MANSAHSHTTAAHRSSLLHSQSLCSSLASVFGSYMWRQHYTRPLEHQAWRKHTSVSSQSPSHSAVASPGPFFLQLFMHCLHSPLDTHRLCHFHHNVFPGSGSWLLLESFSLLQFWAVKGLGVPHILQQLQSQAK